MLGLWLDRALLLSPSQQATLGQTTLGVPVVDLTGRCFSFARASGRFFATMLTGSTFGIGYVIMRFTVRQQILHDLLAGTLVVR